MNKIILLLAVVAVLVIVGIAFVFLSGGAAPPAMPSFSIPTLEGFSPGTAAVTIGNPFESVPDQNKFFVEPVNPFEYENPFE